MSKKVRVEIEKLGINAAGRHIWGVKLEGDPLRCSKLFFGEEKQTRELANAYVSGARAVCDILYPEVQFIEPGE